MNKVRDKIREIKFKKIIPGCILSLIMMVAICSLDTTEIISRIWLANNYWQQHIQPVTLSNSRAAENQSADSEFRQKINKLNIPFIANQGQTDERIKFYTTTFWGTVFVTNDGQIIHSLLKVKGKKSAKGLSLKEEFIGGMVHEVKGEKQAVTRVNYFKGRDKSKWENNIPAFDLISLGEVYNGVEIKLKAYGNNVEKLFFVESGADPEMIKVKLSGGKLNVNNNGELEVETDLGTVKFTKPVAYQEDDSTGHTTNSKKKEFVEVAYVVNGDEYGFSLGKYDRGKVLVIDPILAATFLGGEAGDFGNAIALDGEGNVYIAGSTAGEFSGVDEGSADSIVESTEGFVAKLDSDLSTILAATFLGGSSFDSASAMVLDDEGNVYVAGDTFSSDFPGINEESADSEFGGSLEAFVVKLDSDLSTILSATFLGGSDFEELENALTIDDMNNVYVAGRTGSPDFPGVSEGSSDNTFEFAEDFIVKLNSDLGTIIAATFLGGSSDEVIFAVALDDTGNIYVAGQTDSSDFPGINAGSADSIFESREAFISKLDPDLSEIISATFLGGSNGIEGASAISPDGMGNVYVAGFTNSSDFPGIDDESADDEFGGATEAFVAKLDSDLSEILSATFLGGSGGNGGETDDVANALVLDGMSNIYVAGQTESSDFPGVNTGSADSAFTGDREAFVAKLDSDLGMVLAATFLGGTDEDLESVTSIALDDTGNVYVAGNTNSSDFPGIDEESADSIREDSEAFVAKLDPNLSQGVANADLSVTKSDSPDPVTQGNDLIYTITVTNNGPDTATDVILIDTLPSGVTVVSASAGCTEDNSTITCRLTPQMAKDDSATVTIVVTPIDAGEITNTASVTGNESDPDITNNMATTTTTVEGEGGDNGNGCAIGGPYQAGTAMANVLIALIPTFVIGIRMLRRRK
ncbi:MAG TPA: SBBP repeat-containing protein [Thermodesulfobacteriota bacterium]|nr:SBBP repeat-containing protein [Thermodesulfobacteriota bacterium]